MKHCQCQGVHLQGLLSLKPALRRITATKRAGELIFIPVKKKKRKELAATPTPTFLILNPLRKYHQTLLLTVFTFQKPKRGEEEE